MAKIVGLKFTSESECPIEHTDNQSWRPNLKYHVFIKLILTYSDGVIMNPVAVETLQAMAACQESGGLISPACERKKKHFI